MSDARNGQTTPQPSMPTAGANSGEFHKLGHSSSPFGLRIVFFIKKSITFAFLLAVPISFNLRENDRSVISSVVVSPSHPSTGDNQVNSQGMLLPGNNRMQGHRTPVIEGHCFGF